jgi:hypothetical protein
MPRKKTGRVRRCKITVRLNEAEEAGLRQDVAKVGMTIEAYSRAIMFKYPIRRVVDTEGMAQLNARMADINCLGALLKRRLVGDRQVPPGVSVPAIARAVEIELRKLDEVLPWAIRRDRD